MKALSDVKLHYYMPKQTGVSKKIYVDKSLIHGRGVFAACDIKKGEYVCRIKGRLCHKVNKNLKDTLGNPDWVGIRKHYWIDPRAPFKYLNHSCRPSAGIKGAVTLIARRNIKAGEEITFHYSITEEDPNWYMRCTCKAHHNKEKIGSVFSLSRKDFQRLMPFIGTYFKKKYLSYTKESD